ncbi:MAG: KH domain-containing protein [Patescibacteria group bacterium]
MEADKAFLEYVIRAIVNNPDDVRVSRTVDERGVLLTLDINAGDMGYVIGRQGQTARAVRTLLKIVGAKNNARVNLKINEPPGGRGPGGGRLSRMGAGPIGTGPSEDIDLSAVDTMNI